MATRKQPARKEPDPFDKQQELAPVVSEVNDAARAAIATINTQLSEFDKVEAGLGDLERRYAKVVYPVDTKTGMDEAVLARREIKGVRVAVEHARKAAKEPVLALGRSIDGRASGITLRLETIEAPIDDQIKAQERKEAERKADLERRVREIQATPAQCIGKTSAQLAEVLEGLNSLPLDDFAEYREQAAAAQEHARQQVMSLAHNAKLAEEAAALRAEQERERTRKAALQLRLNSIGGPLILPYRTSERVQQAIDRLQAVEIGADFEEFAPAAREEKARVLAELTKIRDQKKADEDARAAAAAAPAPTPAPSLAPAASYRPLVGVGVAATVGAEALQRMEANLHDFTPDVLPAWEDAAQKTFPAPSTELSISTTQRPTDTEILALVASHYDVTWGEAARWLRSIDFAAALAQQPLPEVA